MNGNGNGHEHHNGTHTWSSPTGVKTGPEIQPEIQSAEDFQSTTRENYDFKLSAEERKPAEANSGAAKRNKRRWKRNAGIAALVAIVAAIAATGLIYSLYSKVSLDLIIGKRNSAATKTDSSKSDLGSGNNLTQQAIKQARESTKDQPENGPEKGAMVQPQASPSVSQLNKKADPKIGSTKENELGGTYKLPSSSTEKSTETSAGRETEGSLKNRENSSDKRAEERAASTAVSNNKSSSQASRSAATNAGSSLGSGGFEHSVYITEAKPEATSFKNQSELPKRETAGIRFSDSKAPDTEKLRNENTTEAKAAFAEVARPEFGTMLPVKSLGAIYSLRSGSLVRFELTRDSSGEGWQLPSGTVFVGTLKGADYDRAFLSMIGFIDPETKRLVKIGGDVLGSDGGSGLKGKRHQLSSRGKRFVAEMGRSGISLLQTALGRSGGTTVIMPGISSTVEPEITNLRGNSKAKEFVEIEAGAPAYIMITDLPKEIQGVDAVADLDPEQLKGVIETSESDASGTGLTDQELAELLSNGTPDEIRAAMPKMTPNMRRIAESILRGGK